MAGKGDKAAGKKVAEGEEDSGAKDDNPDESVALPAKKRNRPDVAGGSSVAAAASESRVPAAVVIQEPNLPAAAAVPAARGERLPWPCLICGKAFHSQKAFFGHLRVHPEKTYKGAFPPPTFDPEGSPEPEAEQVEAAVPPVPNEEEASGVNTGIDLNVPPREEDDEE
uniref:C2H2-type domain-containing protein n=1 Tax=Kalanchoe fedtschenkoi TaxID=63787 RepID=A0A7N0UG65_KALFE